MFLSRQHLVVPIVCTVLQVPHQMPWKWPVAETIEFPTVVDATASICFKTKSSLLFLDPLSGTIIVPQKPVITP